MNKEEFVKKIYSSKYIDKMVLKTKKLGIDYKKNPYNLILYRLITSIIIFVFLLYYYEYGYIIAPICTLIYYLLYNKITIDDKLTQRKEQLETEAMHFFEVLTLSLETGRNLAEAIKVTTENVDGILSREFNETIEEINFGKSLTEALNDMHKRIPSDTVNNIILSLTQANLYGNSIIESLYSQIDYLREKKKQEMKGKISKIPVKISIISVLFFIPLIMIIILGPIILQYIN